jgi:hypothetical protein
MATGGLIKNPTTVKARMSIPVSTGQIGITHDMMGLHNSQLLEASLL